VVTVWGRLEAHRDGLRAEHARVEVLARPDRADRERRRAAEAVAERLGVSLVAAGELPRAAAEIGAPLPPSLLPG